MPLTFFPFTYSWQIYNNFYPDSTMVGQQMAAINTTPQLDAPYKVCRARIQIRNIGNTNNVLSNLRIEYSPNGGTNWYPMSSSNHWNWAASDGQTDGALITQRLVTGSTNNGCYCLTGTQTSPTINFGPYYYEFDFAIQPTIYSTPNTTYIFRLVYSTSSVIPIDGSHTKPAIKTLGTYAGALLTASAPNFIPTNSNTFQLG